MSDKLAMVALDKVDVKFSMRVETVVRLRRIMAECGLKSLSAIVNALLEEAVRDVRLTKDDIDTIHEMMVKNLEKRNERKAKKGIK